MALPNPGMNFTPFDKLPASDLNKMVANDEYLETKIIPASQIDFSTFYKAKIYNSANVSIPNGAWTPVGFNSEVFDVGPMHSTSVDNQRITIPVGGDGVYIATGMVTFATNNTGIRGARFTINSDVTNYNQSGGWIGNSEQGTDTRSNICATMTLAAGDYVTLDVIQTSGGALNILNVSSETWQTSSFSLVRVA